MYWHRKKFYPEYIHNPLSFSLSNGKEKPGNLLVSGTKAKNLQLLAANTFTERDMSESPFLQPTGKFEYF